MKINPDQLVTMTEAARIAGMSRQNLYQTWLNSGWVRLVRLAGRPFLFREDAERIWATREKAGRVSHDVRDVKIERHDDGNDTRIERTDAGKSKPQSRLGGRVLGASEGTRPLSVTV